MSLLRCVLIAASVLIVLASSHHSSLSSSLPLSLSPSLPLSPVSLVRFLYIFSLILASVTYAYAVLLILSVLA